MAGKVVHCKKEKFDVYIGRPSKWGNPFSIGKDGDREAVIKKYNDWILNQPLLMSCLHELKDKVLGCWCAPKRCHGDVLLQLIEDRTCRWCGEFVEEWDTSYDGWGRCPHCHGN